MTVTDDLHVTEISDEEQFVEMQDKWNAILANRRAKSVFLRHEWFDAAWQWCRRDSSLRLLSCYQGPNLIAIAPLSSTRQRGRFGSFTQLSFVYVPDTQECDLVVSEEDAPLAVRTIVGHLSNHTDWDVARFRDVRLDSCLANHIRAACNDGQLKIAIRDAGENPEVILTGDWQSYYAARSKRLRKGNNNIRNRIHADGNKSELHWSLEPTSESVTTELLLRNLKHVSSISWKNETGSSLDNAGPSAFIDRLSEHAMRNNWLSIWALEINGRIAATEYQLIYEGVVEALRADHDPAFSSLSPGSYLNWKILETLFQTENQLYRMGAGNNPYKLRWADNRTPLQEIRIYNATFRGQCLWFLEERLLPLMRSLADRFARLRK